MRSRNAGQHRHQRSGHGGDERGLAPALGKSFGLAEGEGRSASIAQQTSLDGEPPRERLKAVIQLYSERLNPDGMAIELAIRQWARSDGTAAAAVASVDAARLKHVAELYRATGLDAEEAEAQAFLFYCFIFGQSLLFDERSPLKRSQLVAKPAEKLLN